MLRRNRRNVGAARSERNGFAHIRPAIVQLCPPSIRLSSAETATLWVVNKRFKTRIEFHAHRKEHFCGYKDGERVLLPFLHRASNSNATWKNHVPFLSIFEQTPSTPFFDHCTSFHLPVCNTGCIFCPPSSFHTPLLSSSTPTLFFSSSLPLIRLLRLPSFTFQWCSYPSLYLASSIFLPFALSRHVAHFSAVFVHPTSCVDCVSSLHQRR